jgi:predicted PP-loop superfamily ATPase
MQYSKNFILSEIKRIRKEVGHVEVKIYIKDIVFDESTNILWIITKDRGSKSAIIGKGGWIVGRLKEDLNVSKIHVESYSDFILKKYQMKLSLKKINSFIEMKINNLKRKDNNPIAQENNNLNELNNDNLEKIDLTGILNLKKLLEYKIDNIYNFKIEEYLEKININDNKKNQAVVALSGGVDSSFSLILAKYLGFNPIAITIDPGTIILPKVFKNNINNLTKKLNIKHYYLKDDYSSVIEDSLNGRFHPCGRCSERTGKNIFEFAYKNDIDMVIFGDLLSTACQSLNEVDFNPKEIDNEINNTSNEINNEYNEITNDHNEFSKRSNENLTEPMFRLNLPATLSIGKGEIRDLTSKFGIKKIKGFGCPLLHESHKKYPYIKKFSIQRILRETRSGALEPGEALQQIWSFYSN